MGNPYAPFKPPFRYNNDVAWIEDSSGHRILDIRGWGYMTGKGDSALGMTEEEAINIQDNIGKYIANLMNA